MNPMLDNVKASHVQVILEEFPNVLISLRGHMKTTQHERRLESDDVVSVKPYSVTFADQQFVKEEVQKLLDFGSC